MLTYSPSDIAQRYGCKPEKVLSWIASRELVAINAATSRDGGKPRWRITPDALDDFERGRTTVPKAKPISRQRSKSPAVTQYF